MEDEAREQSAITRKTGLFPGVSSTSTFHSIRLKTLVFPAPKKVSWGFIDLNLFTNLQDQPNPFFDFYMKTLKERGEGGNKVVLGTPCHIMIIIDLVIVCCHRGNSLIHFQRKILKSLSHCRPSHPPVLSLFMVSAASRKWPKAIASSSSLPVTSYHLH